MTRAGTKQNHRITDFESFRELALNYELVPLVMVRNVEEETPLSVYKKLRSGNKFSFLFESGESGKASGRFSFIGTSPEKIFRVLEKGCEVLELSNGSVRFYTGSTGLDEALKEYLSCKNPLAKMDLPPFCGGIAGYFSYEMVEEWEDLFHGKEGKLQRSHLDRALLMGFLTIIAFDHEKKSLYLVHNVRIPAKADEAAIVSIYREGRNFLNDLNDQTQKSLSTELSSEDYYLGETKAATSKKFFLDMVRAGRERIIAGDICQVVLSQQFSIDTNLLSLDVYETLKEVNPSPYLFYLDLPELEIIGSSPEVLVKVEGSKVTSRPLAGTRRRGSTPQEDSLLAAELLADEKERAEHIMLVDLARNDLGRICKTGTVKVTELMDLEYYSRVIHIVSQVEGEKKDEAGCIEVLRSAFPAGTVSGAPKIRAMEIIDELESCPRGPYAGAAGYIGFDQNLDTCIVIRTMIREGNTITVQAGAGIVYDSVPETEYEETRNKASALLGALKNTLERRRSK